MIYNTLLALSQSVKEFCRFWNLQGLVLMTSAVIQDFNPLTSQASSLKARPIVKMSATNADSSLAAATSDESSVHRQDRQATFPEIFSYALPSSPKVLKLNDLVEQVWIIREGTSLIDRDDSKTAQAFILITDIVDLHWDEFSVKTKVLLLDKLQPFNKSTWRFILEIFSKLPSALKEKKERNKKYGSQYGSLDKFAQKELIQKFRSNFILLATSVFKTLNVTSKIFKKDGYLLKENEKNISKFNHSIRTMIAARYLMKKHCKVLEELAK
jgi:hypothetical protein